MEQTTLAPSSLWIMTISRLGLIIPPGSWVVITAEKVSSGSLKVSSVVWTVKQLLVSVTSSHPMACSLLQDEKCGKTWNDSTMIIIDIILFHVNKSTTSGAVAVPLAVCRSRETVVNSVPDISITYIITLSPTMTPRWKTTVVYTVNPRNTPVNYQKETRSCDGRISTWKRYVVRYCEWFMLGKAQVQNIFYSLNSSLWMRL